jgi:hypothetical protein
MIAVWKRSESAMRAKRAETAPVAVDDVVMTLLILP